MGRKIPAKKHRGVKDPLVQQAKRLESLKGKINAPPKDPDEQPMPRSLIRLFGLTEPNKKNTTKKRRQNKTQHVAHAKDDAGSCNNPISRLRKLPGESGRGFSLRINSAIKALHNPDEDIDYPQDLEAEDHKGQQMAAQRERRARKRRRSAQGQQGEPPMSRTQKLALKKKAKKMKALEVSQARAELEYERVPFGTVAHAPPALPAPPRGAQPQTRARRGLLLEAMLGAPARAHARAQEEARRAAVAAYRALKASKHKHK